MRSYFNCHNHTMYSNLRLLDAINTPEALIDKAAELGMCGIAITDHECVSAWVKAKRHEKKIREQYPDFKVGLGNEIYLTDTRDKGQKYYHFLMIAKDAIGAKALRELSTIAWYNVYVDRKLERVPTLKSELKEVMSKYKGHVVATSACIGGELSSNALLYAKARGVGDINNAQVYYDNIIGFIEFCKDIFGDDFYIECAPSTYEDQIIVNRQLMNIAIYCEIPMVVGTDSHYLTKNERAIHKAYLNSKEGDREVDSFYEFAHLMDSDEVTELLMQSFDDIDRVNWILDNTYKIYDKIEDYELERKQIIPKVEVKNYPKSSAWEYDNYPTLRYLLDSDNEQERYWINECLIALNKMELSGEEDNLYTRRLEIEADIIKTIGDKLNDCLFAYFNTFQHYINLFWDCGSIVGPGRGSATGFLSNYLLGITQLNPLRWDLPYWRFLNKERAELPDIDIDLAPSKRPEIFKRIRDERGEFGLVQVATFGTEGTKSAILTACRGYRSEEYPDGIDVDEAQYMSSLIPQERGFLWDIKDVIYGNEEKDRKPVTTFINTVNQYPGLLDIIVYICGLVNKRSSHASGVILYGNDPFETASFMRTPSGDLITCFDLHEAEACGDTKYDFLVTEVSDKIIQCIDLLEEDGVLEHDSLRNIYNKYLHPEVIDTTNPVIWEHLEAGDVLDVFQFNEGSGLAIAKKCKPKNIFEMMCASAMMRLMSEKGKESQQDRYVRIQKEGLQSFDMEMRKRGLSDETRAAMHKYCDTYWGCVPIQEQMMEILMDKDIAGFTLAEANAARKVVAKKQMDKIPQLRTQLYEHINNNVKAEYIWETAVRPSLGYAFSKNHSLPYSFVGVQTIYLATHFNPIYWNCACLIVNSGALEEDEETIEEDDKKKKVATDYAKIAKALGNIISSGIKIGLVDINKSDFGFKPDVENNQILYGLKPLLNVSDDTAKIIIDNRPYVSVKDFLQKTKLGKQAIISLIKSGAFDNMMDRRTCMAWYLWETCDKKSDLNLRNLAGLLRNNLIPLEQEDLKLAYRYYEFNRYLKTIKFILDERAVNFLQEQELEELFVIENNVITINPKQWDKIYQRKMDVFRTWIAENKIELLQKLNDLTFQEAWEKYAAGSISAWEMEAMCFYYHEHELIDVDKKMYGFTEFADLPVEPEIIREGVSKKGIPYKIYKLSKICGTCIAKNKNKSIVTLLTTSGVVNVKFRKEYFSLFDKQISRKQEDGTKKVVEKSWFNRGSMIAVQGIRSGDNFIPKKYADTPGHQLYKIDTIYKDGRIALRNERYQGDIEEEDNV